VGFNNFLLKQYLSKSIVDILKYFDNIKNNCWQCLKLFKVIVGMNSKVVVMKKIGLLSIALVLCLPAYAGDSLSLAVGSKVDYFNIGKKILFAGSVAASIYTLKVGRDRFNKKKAFEDTSFTDSKNNVTISVKDILRDSGKLKQLSKTTDLVNFKKSCESLINDCSCSGFNPLTSLANYFAFGKGYLSLVESVSKSIDVKESNRISKKNFCPVIEGQAHKFNGNKKFDHCNLNDKLIEIFDVLKKREKYRLYKFCCVATNAC
jgi:hypothetical protein